MPPEPPTPTTLLLEPVGGLAGDMFLGALMDLGASETAIRSGLATLGLQGWTMQVAPATRRHVGATKVDFAIPHEHVHRHLSDIEAIIDASGLPDPAKNRAILAFTKLAAAEARVHRIDIQEVHFHEVGAMDAILDICGTSLALELLGVEEVLCGPLPGGSGTVVCAHGEMPLPAPAVSELLTDFALILGEGEGEMVTPTGAALLVANGRPLPPQTTVRIARAGYGAGTRPSSLLRASLVLPAEGRSTGSDPDVSFEEVVVLTCEVDDMTGEAMGYLSETLAGAAALDVSFSPVTMKKNRPGIRVQVLCAPTEQPACLAALLRHSTSLGVRLQTTQRAVLARRMETVETPWGPVRLKLAGGRARPEYEDCAALARAHNLALHEVMQAAVQAYLADPSP